MKKPDIPDDEAKRLESLNALDILDTPAEERIDRWTRLTKRIFDVPIVLVSLVDENRQWFKSVIGLDTRETPREISFCGHAILEDKTFIVPNATKDERFADNPLVQEGPKIRFYAGCPLKSIDGRMLGTLCLIDTQPRPFDAEDDVALKDLAKSVELEFATTHMATNDDLTNLSNRRGFIALAQKGLNLCARLGAPAQLVYFDLNGFKAINDTHGHAEGDRALVTFAEKLRETFRDADVVGRLGGDEFVVLLTNTLAEKTDEILVRLSKSIDAINQKTRRDYDISFSHGVVTCEGDDNTIDSLLKRADDLMYKAKQKKSGSRKTDS